MTRTDPKPQFGEPVVATKKTRTVIKILVKVAQLAMIFLIIQNRYFWETKKIFSDMTLQIFLWNIVFIILVYGLNDLLSRIDPVFSFSIREWMDKARDQEEENQRIENGAVLGVDYVMRGDEKIWILNDEDKAT